MKAVAESETEIRYLHGLGLKFEVPEGSSQLRVHIDGDQCILRALVKLAFPLSTPDRYISVQDEEGNEIGVVRTLSELDPTSREVVEAELDRRYFTPKISKIVKLEQEAGLWTFTVETSRGPSVFYVRNWRDSSSEIAPGRFLIQSVDGKRYEVPNYENLDPRSQAFLEQLF